MFDTDRVGLEAGESTTELRSPPAGYSATDGYWNADGWWVDTTPDPMDPSPSRDQPVPEGLGSEQTGTGLGALLSGLKPDRVPGYGVVEASVAHARMMAHHHAGFYAFVAQLLDVFDGDRDLAAAELAAAHHLTRRASEREVDFAIHLQRFPQVLRALDQGLIGIREVRVIVNGVTALPTETGSDLIDIILPEAPELTTGQIGSRLRKLRLTLTPVETAAEHAAGLEDRRVVVDANPDGTANLHAYNIDPTTAMAIRDRIGHLARRTKTQHDPRTADQVRADVFCDLLLRSNGDKQRATVNLVVDLATLAELANNPAHIPGYGPVAAEIARKHAETQADCRWEFTIRDNGKILSTGTVRRRPTRAMKRTIRAHYPTCVWPGCRMPACESDLDHRNPWAQHGKTNVRNLGPLCRYHHMLRTKGWAYTRHEDGTHQFTSPLGHTYTTGADPPLM